MSREYSAFLYDENIISPEGWELISKCKRDFLQNKIKDPRDFPQINPRIAESWIRSKNMNVDAYYPKIKFEDHQQNYGIIEATYRPLVDLTKPLFNIIEGMIETDYYLEIINKDGLSLMHEGNLELPPVAIQGRIFNESTMGTNAHMLCMEYKKPVQLIGPEHYCVDLENIIASSAPIIDENGNAIASVVLTQPVSSPPPWEDNFCRQLSTTMRLLISIAAAIEAQMKFNNQEKKLEKANEYLQLANDTLDAAVACINDGVITVDRYGQILRINPEGKRILDISANDYKLRNIKDYLDSNSNIMELLKQGKNIDTEETIYTGKGAKTYLMDIYPVLSYDDKQVQLALLRLHCSEKTSPPINNRNGASTRFCFDDIIGQSSSLKKTIERAKRFARSAENIMLVGESGTGKELFAQAIHNMHRPNGPFMAVNCAAMPRELIESELFGYEGGSFTGAERSGRPGKIELAHGGTLFLDEIGDMPLDLQAVLLRVLEDKEVMRIGGRRYKKVDFRVVAATNKNLLEMVRERQFREDLYFRLSVLPIELPPLRKRGNDAEILSQYFLEKYCRKWNLPALELSAEAKKVIRQYDWPGNIRQLQNAINYAVNTVKGNIIKANDFPDNILMDSGPVRLSEITNSAAKGEDILSVKNLEKAAIEVALVQAQNSIPRAAALLGMSKATLYRKIKEYEKQ